MIVQPDFPEHWKTRSLVELTGDKSAPMAVIRLWAHCQSSRRWEFPDMTPAQLASICRWENTKVACHTALIKCRFLDRLNPRGFAAHNWPKHNAQLIQRWNAGLRGGRPPHSPGDQNPKISEKGKDPPTQNASQNDGKTEDSEKPTDNRPITARVLDQIRPDQTRPDQIDKTRPDQTRPEPSGQSAPSSDVNGHGGGVEFQDLSGDGGNGVVGLVGTIAQKLTLKAASRPSLTEVRSYLKTCFSGAEDYAKAFYNAMEKQHWLDRHRKPITDWRSMAYSYASKAHLKQRSGR